MSEYSQYKGAKMDPLSLEEILAVPLYKQKQYDALEEARIKQADMFKIDPLEVHKERAQKLNNDYMNKVDELANYQARTGDIQGSKSKLLQLQREYKKLTDPMGEVAKTNAAKIAYNNEKTRFLEAATKQYGSDRALQLWNQHASKYAGYDDKGNIINIGSKGIVQNKNFDEELKNYHSLLGSITSSAASSGYQIKDAGQGDGSKVMVNSSGQRVHSDNIDALNSMRKAMASDWLVPGGQGYAFNEEAGINQANFTSKFNNLMDAQRVVKDERKSDVNANYIAPPKGTESTGANDFSVFGEDYNTSEIGGKKGDYSQLEKIGEKLYGSAQGYLGKQPVSHYTSNSISDPKQKALYDAMWNKATTTGIKVGGKLMKLTPEAIKKGKDNKENAQFIIKSLKENPGLTLTSKLLTTNQIINTQGFVAGLGNDAKAVNNNIRLQLQRNDSSGRKLVDENGKTMSWNDAVDKYNLSGINDVNYQGYISPLNWEDNSTIGTNSRFSPHVITVKDKDNNWHTFRTTRLSSDNIGLNVKRQNEITKNYRDATLNYNTWNRIESSYEPLTKYKTKYNPSETDIDNNTGEPKIWSLQTPKGDVIKITESQYLNFMNSVK